MHQPLGHTARSAAAGLQGRAIGVPEFDPCGSVCAIKHHRQLIEADAGVTIAETASDLRADRIIQTTAIDDEEVVAMGVHLHERQRHGVFCER